MKTKKIKQTSFISVLIVLLFFSSVALNQIKFEKSASAAAGVNLYISKSGSDSNSGAIDSPFLTLEKARDKIVSLKNANGGMPPIGGVTVWIRGGVYERSSTFRLDSDDSGTVDRPITYSSYNNEVVRIIGGKTIPSNKVSLVNSSSSVWSKLDSSAQGLIYQVDLKQLNLGISDYGSIAGLIDRASTDIAPVQFFMNQSAMPISRWPDAGVNTQSYTPANTSLSISGTMTPNISGNFTKYKTIDGVNAYKRDGLVDGKQYYFHRYTWTYSGTQYTAWFMKTNDNAAYPGSNDPWWSSYSTGFGQMSPSNGAAGSFVIQAEETITEGYANTASAMANGEFSYYGTRPSRWTTATNAWLFGYWNYDYSASYGKLSGVNASTKKIAVTNLTEGSIKTGRPYFVKNLVEEITTPGEWYIDSTNGILYFYPVAPVTTSEMIVSTFPSDLILVSGASNIKFNKLTIEMTRRSPLRITNSSNIEISSSVIRNAGTDGVVIYGTDNKITKNDIYSASNSAIVVNGGSRANLTMANNVIQNNKIHDNGLWQPMVTPPILIYGVGQKIIKNDIYNVDGTTMSIRGNNNLIQYNDIYNVDRYVNDMGAIYANGIWENQGNVIRNNYIHNSKSKIFGNDVNGIYIDDCTSGAKIIGNIVDGAPGAAIKHGGGRDDVFVNNVLINSGKAFSTDSRGITKIDNTAGSAWNVLERLKRDGVSYNTGVWASQYPGLASIPNNWSIISNPAYNWRYPQGVIMSRNIGYNNGTWISEGNYGGTGTINKFTSYINNIQNQNPGLSYGSSSTSAFSNTSPVYGISGFMDINFREIGADSSLANLNDDYYDVKKVKIEGSMSPVVTTPTTPDVPSTPPTEPLIINPPVAPNDEPIINKEVQVIDNDKNIISNSISSIASFVSSVLSQKIIFPNINTVQDKSIDYNGIKHNESEYNEVEYDKNNAVFDKNYSNKNIYENEIGNALFKLGKAIYSELSLNVNSVDVGLQDRNIDVYVSSQDSTSVVGNVFGLIKNILKIGFEMY